MTETQLHIALVEWVRLQYPREAEYLHHSPNEGKHKVQYRVKQKRLGVSAGFPDLVLYLPRGGFTGLAIELKSDSGNKPTQSQIDWLDRLGESGWMAAWCRGFDAAKDTINQYMGLSNV